MKLWEKAKQKYPSLNKNDFIETTCPNVLFNTKDLCNKIPLLRDRDIKQCTVCWEREVDK